jgi:hypothetical protein
MVGIPGKLEKALLVKDAPGGCHAAAGAAIGGFGGFLPMIWDDQAYRFEFRFNPSDLRESQTANFAEHPTSGATGSPTTSYNGPNNPTLSFTVLLDEWEAPPGPLATDVGEMVKKLCPDATAPQAQSSQPPVMSFIWGKYHFKGYVTSVNATYTLFRRDGSPARAEVQISMKGNHEPLLATNPTSGGPAGRNTRQLLEGDSLQSMSFREYGDPNLWRAIADINGVDDPLAVPPGTHLLLPAKTDAQAMR